MTDKVFQHENNLARAVLEIISDYQPIPTEDIWYELGEDDSFEDRIALAEVNEILCHLEKGRRILKENGGKWRLKGPFSKTCIRTLQQTEIRE